MLAEEARQSLLASDLANATTPAYKPERAALHAFGALLAVERGRGTLIGELGLGVSLAFRGLDLSQGPLRETGDPLDVALEGQGFLVVDTPAGRRYLRGGRLTVDVQGRLATPSGHPLLDDQGRAVVVGGEGFSLAADGTVSVDGRPVGRLAVVSLEAPVREGEGLYRGQPGARPDSTSVRQGWLEGSSVDTARTMVDALASLRAFEALQRVIRAIDESLGRAINGVQA